MLNSGMLSTSPTSHTDNSLDDLFVEGGADGADAAARSHSRTDNSLAAVTAVLTLAGLKQFEPSFHNIYGVYTTGDFAHIKPDDCLQIGMTYVQVEKLKECLFWAYSTPLDCLPEIVSAHVAAECEAREALKAAIATGFGGKYGRSIVNCLDHASRCLADTSQLPQGAALALSALHRGMASLGPTGTGTNILNELVRKVRDVLVWRVQMKVPWTSRERFIEELAKAQ